jgi:hypothetical protein
MSIALNRAQEGKNSGSIDFEISRKILMYQEKAKPA